MVFRKLRVILTIDTSAPDDRDLSHDIAQALDRLLKDEKFRRGVGKSGESRTFSIAYPTGLREQTIVRVRHVWCEYVCGIPAKLFWTRLPSFVQDWFLRRVGMDW